MISMINYVFHSEIQLNQFCSGFSFSEPDQLSESEAKYSTSNRKQMELE